MQFFQSKCFYRNIEEYFKLQEGLFMSDASMAVDLIKPGNNTVSSVSTTLTSGVKSGNNVSGKTEGAAAPKTTAKPKYANVFEQAKAQEKERQAKGYSSQAYVSPLNNIMTIYQEALKKAKETPMATTSSQG